MHIKKENAAYKYPTNNLLREDESGKEKKNICMQLLYVLRAAVVITPAKC